MIARGPIRDPPPPTAAAWARSSSPATRSCTARWPSRRSRTEHADDARQPRAFVLEAEITGGLEHPGIVPVYGLGTLRRRPALLRDAVHPRRQPQGRHRAVPSPTSRPGRDPGERTLALRELLGRFLDVCNAIAYAHSRGVLHRDLKPGNIMLGQYGETLVVDWGLAKPVGPSREPACGRDGADAPARRRAAAVRRPQLGAALGTPAYMSPEQAAGRLDELGPASDVYSLGATLYCLLTGRAAVRRTATCASCPRARSSGASSRRRGRSTRGSTAALEAICLKAMAQRAAATATASPGRWPTTSSTGWRTSRSRPGGSRWPPSRSAAGVGGTGWS